MTPRSSRIARSGLLLLILVVGVSVAWTVRQGPRGAPPPSLPAEPGALPAPPSTEPAHDDKQVIEKTVMRRMEGDKVKFEVIADKVVGKEKEETQLSGVQLTFHYMAQGVSHAATVTASQARFNEATQKVSFRGDVVVRTDDKMEMKTDALVYRGDKQLAHSDGPVAFVRKSLHGTSTGMSYDGGNDHLELTSDVHLRIEDPDDPLATIDAGHAVIDRTAGNMKFNGGVKIVQAGDTLTAEKVVADLVPGTDRYAFERAQATDDVVLQTTGGPLPGTATGARASGPQRLASRKLDLYFNPNRTLKEATAGPDADFTASPGQGEVPEKRHLKGKVLTFRFDEQGRMQEVQAQKDAFFETTPVPPAKGDSRTVTCQSFVGTFDPATGNVAHIDFRLDVVFKQGTLTAHANNAAYDGAKSLLNLRDDPQLLDASQGSDLSAGAIDLWTASGDVAARRNVKHTVQPKKKGHGLIGAGGTPLVITSQAFGYDAAKRTATYRENALLKSGADEIRARLLTVVDSADGKRRLEGEGGVASALTPQKQAGGEPPVPIVGRSKRLVYDETAGKLVYSGDASIRQGQLQTKSPEATIALGADGSTVQNLVAGEPVDVVHGTRHATGTRATFDPAAKTLVITGEKVVVDDPEQQTQGRSVTFHTDDERVTVDGQDVVRTEIRIKKALPTAAASPAPPAKPAVKPSGAPLSAAP
jgi:LPS export ABC transporter protein LptC/lipopolysaccharide transport protein LptA